MKEKKVNNWYREGKGYVFTFAREREAIGVKVDLEHGDIGEEEEGKLRIISEGIISHGLPVLGIGPLELEAVSREDYLSDRYTHPADDFVEGVRDLQEREKGILGGKKGEEKGKKTN